MVNEPDAQKTVDGSKVKKSYHITDSARKYYQANLPQFYRDLPEEGYSENNEESMFEKKIPPFDPDTVPSIPADRLKRLQKLLHSEVEFQGKNFSHTQKKLLQVGKAILARPNVLLLDSNFFKVEEALEQLLFELIFKNLQSSTIVAIMERYEQLHYFDKVLVFEKGAVVEQGSPDELLAKNEGHFKKLVKIREEQDKKLLNNGRR